jgi:cyclopropane fatty-acyl-phospholipid synthase-like methyltransferase
MMINNQRYISIISHYESCFTKHGDTHLGVDWPNWEDSQTRYRVMLEVIRESSKDQVSLLDFGCGTSHLYEYMLRHSISNVKYSGLDISEKYIRVAKTKYPDIKYYCLNVLENSDELPEFDYVVMNGVFTEKCTLSFDEMWAYFQRAIAQVFSKVHIGMAFNVMSKQVDWEREDLFHLPMDLLTSFLKREISRHFVLRHEYGLYEYTTYIYRSPIEAPYS